MYKSEFFTQINLHLYFDKIKDKDLIEQVLIFKSKRKFNPLVVMLLREHIQKQRDTFALDSQSLPYPRPHKRPQSPFPQNKYPLPTRHSLYLQSLFSYISITYVYSAFKRDTKVRLFQELYITLEAFLA